MEDAVLLKVKLLDPAAALPAPATPGSAGLDLCAVIDGPLTLLPSRPVTVDTGLAVEIPPGYVGYIFARSGLAVRHGVTLSNGVGVIDSDYRGPVCVGLCNISDTPHIISPGDRVAQLVIMPVPEVKVEQVERLSPTGRGAGGFGSTGA